MVFGDSAIAKPERDRFLPSLRRRWNVQIYHTQTTNTHNILETLLNTVGVIERNDGRDLEHVALTGTSSQFDSFDQFARDQSNKSRARQEEELSHRKSAECSEY